MLLTVLLGVFLRVCLSVCLLHLMVWACLGNHSVYGQQLSLVDVPTGIFAWRCLKWIWPFDNWYVRIYNLFVCPANDQRSLAQSRRLLSDENSAFSQLVESFTAKDLRALRHGTELCGIIATFDLGHPRLMVYAAYTTQSLKWQCNQFALCSLLCWWEFKKIINSQSILRFDGETQAIQALGVIDLPLCHVWALFKGMGQREAAAIRHIAVHWISGKRIG